MFKIKLAVIVSPRNGFGPDLQIELEQIDVQNHRYVQLRYTTNSMIKYRYHISTSMSKYQYSFWCSILTESYFMSFVT